MSNRVNQSFIVNAGGSSIYLALITGNDGAAVQQADINSISRVIKDTQPPNAVTTDAITVSTVITDTPFTDALWDELRNMTDVIEASKFPKRNDYTLQYTFTPTSGEVFKSRELTIHGD